MSGSSSNNLISEFSIVIQFGGLIFTHADLLDFSYRNKINERPYGEFLLVDRNSDFVETKSGDFGQMMF